MAEPTQSLPEGQTFYEDGRPVPAAEIAKATAEGRARWKLGEKVPFIAPDGKGYLIPAETAQAQVRAGWTPTDPATFSRLEAQKTPATLGDVAASAALGVARIPTFGLSDALVSKETQERLEAKAPIAGGIGEVAGLAYTVRNPGAIATAGERAGVALASRIPQGLPAVRSAVVAATQGATEGAAISAGTELARIAQGDEDFNTEAFASAVGRGALTSAAFVGVAGGGISLAGRGISRGTAGLRKSYEELRDAVTARAVGEVEGGAARLTSPQKAVAKSVGISGTDIKNAGVEKAQRYLQDLLDTGVIRKESAVAAALDDFPEKARKIGARLDEVGSEIGATWRQADAEFGEKLVDITKTSRTVVDPVTGKKHVVQDRLEGLAGTKGLEAKQRLMKPLAAYVGSVRARGGPFEGVAAKLDNWLDAVKKAESYEDLHALDTALRKDTEGLSTDKLYGDAVHGLRDELKSTLREELRGINPVSEEKLRKLDELYSAYAVLSPKSIEAAAKAQAGKRDITPFDAATVALGVVGGSPAALAFGGTKIETRLAQESDRVSAGFARYLENQRVKKAAGEFVDAATKATQSERISLFSSVQDAARRSAASVPRAVSLLAAKQHAKYEKDLEEASQAVTNPQAATSRLETQLLPLAVADGPRAAKVAEIRLGDLMWLEGRFRPFVDPTAASPFALAQAKGMPSIKVPPSVAASVARASEALRDPVTGLKVLRKNEPVAPELVDAIRQRRPKLRDALELEFDREAADLMAKGKVMSYETRISASDLTGKAYDPTMTPKAMKFYASIHASRYAPTTPPDAQGAYTASPPGRRPAKAARERLGRYRTTAQDMMEKEQM